VHSRSSLLKSSFKPANQTLPAQYSYTTMSDARWSPSKRLLEPLHLKPLGKSAAVQQRFGGTLDRSSALAPLNELDFGQHLVQGSFVGLGRSEAELLFGSVRHVRADEAPCYEAGPDPELCLEGQVAVGSALMS
jgi:hypothetical protein